MADDLRTSTPSPAEEMPTAYDPHATERRRYEEWMRRGLFGARPNSGRPPFCIVLPPPNVTGALHIGHAFQQTYQDVIVRRKRMQGFETLWLPGTDHAGIATQVVVERELAKEGIDRRELGREAFVERVWQWKEQYGGRIVEQMQALGSSCDWSRLRFTMDDGLARAVRVAFVRLYEAGLIYRGERLVNWCPKDTTAISDSEVEHEDVDGELVTFRYDIVDPYRAGPFHIDVATTRVETMLGDTGIAVHPDDERYANAIGLKVRHPFDGRELPIVADEAVDRTFGTGAVKVTPAHDPTDFEIGTRHGFPLLNILTAEGRISDAAAEEFRGLDRYEARERVRERLREMGRIVAEERPYRHSVGHCYRCHTEIEPWLAGLQWFVAVDRLKGPAKEAALDGRIAFYPGRWIRAYTQWLDGLRDWNISRNLWWGHRIPVWYCPDGHQTAAALDPDACATCGSQQLEQDPAVLDTWFSSQLWPFSTLGWPDQTEDLAFFYPTSALVTGYDILYLWVARMIMSGLFLTEDVPFRHVVIHGLVRDPTGRKMSKSLGNSIDPLDVIARVGADALRFAMMRQAGGAQEIPLGEEYIEAARRFANKIWNASRLVLRAGGDDAGPPELPPLERLTIPERWLLSRLDLCLDEVDRAMEEYRVGDVAQSLYRFVWSELCDWGLEVEKTRLYEGSDDERRDAANVLTWVLERTLRMLHPVMPFITEEIWQRLDRGESIVVAPWPERIAEHHELDAADFEVVQEVVSAIRSCRKSYGVRDSMSIAGVCVSPRNERARQAVERLRHEIGTLANVTIERVGEPDARDGFVVATSPAAETFLPLGSYLDLDVERSRIEKRLDALRTGAAGHEAKLANEGFTSKAPAEIVEKERRRLADIQEEIAALGAQIEELR